jgi:hypothetical protein
VSDEQSGSSTPRRSRRVHAEANRRRSSTTVRRHGHDYNLDESAAALPCNPEYAVKLRALRTRLGLPVDAGASCVAARTAQHRVLAAPLDSPQLADFVNNLDRINALADSSPASSGVCRPTMATRTALRPFGDDTLVNLSVWEDFESLRRFVYQSAHAAFVRVDASSSSNRSIRYSCCGGYRDGTCRIRPKRANGSIGCDARVRAHAAFEFRKIFPAPSSHPESRRALDARVTESASRAQRGSLSRRRSCDDLEHHQRQRAHQCECREFPCCARRSGARMAPGNDRRVSLHCKAQRGGS